MTSLLARILLSVLMIPLAVMCFAVIFAGIAGSTRKEETAIVFATVITAGLVAAYWYLLWRRSVVWSPARMLRTIAGSVGCSVAGVLAAVLMMSLIRIHDMAFGIFFGGVFTIVVWLPVTVLIWKETAAERAERIRHSAGDVVFCPRCGYNMTGLYEPRCPECGAKFTLNQLYAAQQREGIGEADEGRGDAGRKTDAETRGRGDAAREKDEEDHEESERRGLGPPICSETACVRSRVARQRWTDMKDCRRDGLTLAELLVVLGIVVFLVVLYVLALPHMRGRPYDNRRMYCAGNLKAIGNGLAVYAMANNNCWPVPAGMPAEADEVGRVTYAPGKIGARRGTSADPYAGESTEQDAALSTTRVFWYLVRAGAASPKSFICPSSDDQADDEDDPQNFWDFRKYSEISYGYQVPFGKRGKPGSGVDQDMALVADKGPYGAALEAGKPHPGVPKMTSKDAPDDWRPWNSPNHDGEGQNVLYGDGHVDFFMTPLAGCKKDNIYTRWSRADAGKDENELARVQGTPPTGIETPWGETDSLIYP